eukprot:RCo049549
MEEDGFGAEDDDFDEADEDGDAEEELEEDHEADGEDEVQVLDEQEAADRVEGNRPQRITTPFLTKYERARVLGTRALQISMGAPVLVPITGEQDPLLIAQKELSNGKIPFIIRRHLPSGEYEDWPVSELRNDFDDDINKVFHFAPNSTNAFV